MITQRLALSQILLLQLESPGCHANLSPFPPIDASRRRTHILPEES